MKNNYTWINWNFRLEEARKQLPEVFNKKSVLEDFSKSTVKHLFQSLIFKNFIKKEILAQLFFCEFWEIFKNTFLTEHLRTTASRSLSKIFHRIPILTTIQIFPGTPLLRSPFLVTLLVAGFLDNLKEVGM